MGLEPNTLAIWPLAMPHSWQLEAQMAPTLRQKHSGKVELMKEAALT
jgi:hypothetical protein